MIMKTAHLKDAFFGCFGERTLCADDGKIAPGRGKPHPDIFLACAKDILGRPVGEIDQEDLAACTEEQRDERAKGLVFEDAIPGMQAAKRAGMKVRALEAIDPSGWCSGPRVGRLGARCESTRRRLPRCRESGPSAQVAGRVQARRMGTTAVRIIIIHRLASFIIHNETRSIPSNARDFYTRTFQQGFELSLSMQGMYII